ncbi:hypothetical protein [Alkalihalobacterium chitinilyticum]|uniref:Uncharacterized protein n=1 Tax=Alkalihalobacterium chitinilyticum TaxID=2980103 RepID=A0ABT5VFE8_9BACI|nr:hypothetical protein [Alkalihalobacterium chitinilyticum]MDE5414144.1 hypothetical protein [Alkalihalobacterium chitinilyticum]
MGFILPYWTKHIIMFLVAVVLVKPVHMVRGQLVRRLGKDYKTLIIFCTTLVVITILISVYGFIATKLSSEVFKGDIVINESDELKEVHYKKGLLLNTTDITLVQGKYMNGYKHSFGIREQNGELKQVTITFDLKKVDGIYEYLKSEGLEDSKENLYFPMDEYFHKYRIQVYDLMTEYLKTGNSYSASLKDIEQIINGQTNHFYISLE